MKLTNLNDHRRWLLPPLLALTLAGCASPNGGGSAAQPFSSSSFDQRSDFGGETVTESVSKTATVVSVDRAKRLVVLKRANGSQATYKAQPNAFAFADVKAGDLVKVTVTEELAVFLGKNGIPTGSGNTAKLRVRVPGGAQAVAAEVGTLTFTAKIIALNDWNDTATLQFSDGTIKTIRVSEAVNLADVSVGDTVSVQITESTVLMLKKA